MVDSFRGGKAMVTTRKPKVFVGSSKEQLALARAVQTNLESEYGAVVTVWPDSVFGLATATWEALERTLSTVHFAVFILTPDDKLTTREKNFSAPRDNVVFELGLFAGKLGLRRTFIIQPAGQKLKLPSDLLGITTAEYDADRAATNHAATVSPACTKIFQAIKERFGETVDMTWEELCSSVETLQKKLRESLFPPDILLGIAPGGITVADSLAIQINGVVPLFCLWGDRATRNNPVDFEHSINDPVKELLSSGKYKRPLIVDNISRTGTALREAKKFVCRYAKDANVKTAVLVVVEDINKDSKKAPDYYVIETQYRDFRMPDKC
jgi:hypoxanthine phosphoribosyltransferase